MAAPPDPAPPVPLVIVGGGGHAKVVIEIIRASGGYRILGCTDAAATAAEVIGVPVLGDDDQLPRLFAAGIRHAFVAIGANRLRLALGQRLLQQGFTLISALHPAAVVSPTAAVGRGVAVMPGAVINACAVIGDFAIINTLAAVEHDCRLGEGVHVAPRAALAGNVTLDTCVSVGIGAVVKPGVRIGAYTQVGAGAAVVSDLAANCLAMGVPARPRAPRPA